MTRFADKVVVITGSSGSGLAAARFASEGATVVITRRNATKLAEITQSAISRIDFGDGRIGLTDGS